jgi:UDP-N-acetylmuramyl pentapeptide phosphotransferase/UDP-N-acetylglucosamine-1-phosphate transferase
MATAPFFCQGTFNQLLMVIISSVILFFTGIYDDIMNMRPSKKLLAQLLASFITIYFSHLRLNSILGYSIGLLPDLMVTTVGCTFFINVFNFIDGIDGLAGMLAIFYALLLGILLFSSGQTSLACLAFSLAGATLGLLYFNYPPARIYMGDTGSMLLGFILFILALNYHGNETGHATETERTAIIAALFSLPVFDALRVFVLRGIKGISPLKADRRHLHYYFLDSGMTHAATAILLTCANVVTVLLVFAGMRIGYPLLAVAGLILPIGVTALWAALRLRK